MWLAHFATKEITWVDAAGQKVRMERHRARMIAESY